MNKYEVGDAVRCSAVFKNVSGVDADPATVTFKVKAPDGTTTTYVYGTDVELVKDSTGHYHVDVDADSPGAWYYRFAATGSGQAANEGAFAVGASQF